MNEEQKPDEKKPDIAALLNQKPPIPNGPQIVPQVVEKRQPDHPTGKIQSQLEQIWAKVQNIDRIGHGNDFILKTLVGFEMLSFNPEKNQFEQFKKIPMTYLAIINGLKAMQKEIAEIKTDIQFMKKAMMGESIIQNVSKTIPCTTIDGMKPINLKVPGSDKVISIPSPTKEEK